MEKTKMYVYSYWIRDGRNSYKGHFTLKEGVDVRKVEEKLGTKCTLTCTYYREAK